MFWNLSLLGYCLFVHIYIPITHRKGRYTLTIGKLSSPPQEIPYGSVLPICCRYFKLYCWNSSLLLVDLLLFLFPFNYQLVCTFRGESRDSHIYPCSYGRIKTNLVFQDTKLPVQEITEGCTPACKMSEVEMPKGLLHKKGTNAQQDLDCSFKSTVQWL